MKTTMEDVPDYEYVFDENKNQDEPADGKK